MVERFREVMEMRGKGLDKRICKNINIAFYYNLTVK